MKTAISIPDDLFENAENLAQRLGVSRSQLYQRAIAAFLEIHGGQLVSEALDDVYGSEPDASQLDPVLEQLQDSSIPPEIW